MHNILISRGLFSKFDVSKAKFRTTHVQNILVTRNGILLLKLFWPNARKISESFPDWHLCFIKTFWIQNKNSWDLETYWKIVIDFIRWKVHRCAAIQTSKSIVKIWHKLRWHFLTWIESWTILEMDGTLKLPSSLLMYRPQSCS